MLTLLFLILSSTAYSDSEVSYANTNGKVVLSGASCTAVETEFSFIKKWADKTSNGPKCSLNIQKVSERCEAEISSCLPEAVTKTIGKTWAEGFTDYEFDAPNCFGLALYTSGFSTALNYVNRDEIFQMMNSGFCKVINSDQVPEPGDVELLFQGDDLIHASTYISPQTVWHKEGGGSRYVPKFSPSASVIPGFQWLGECKKCKDMKSSEPRYEFCESCREPVSKKYYRCENVAEAQKKSRAALDILLQKKLLELDSTTCQASDLFFKTGALSETAVENLNHSIFVLAQYFHDENQKQAVKEPPESDRDWFLSMLSIRLANLFVQSQSASSFLSLLKNEEVPTGLTFKIKALLVTEK